MKIDQIAYVCNTETDEEKLKKMLSLEKADWIQDRVSAKTKVWRENSSLIAPSVGFNVAALQFNYDLGIELEILRYLEGPNWHETNKEGLFFSHVGVHLAPGESFPEMAGAKLVQETRTTEHTAEYLTTGAGKGRTYHYKIFQISPGNFIKFIKRIDQ